MCAQTELKLKKFRHLLFEKQLKFFWRILHLPPTRWIHQALLEHINGGWESNYLKYVFRIRGELNMLTLPPSLPLLSHYLDMFFIGEVNVVVSQLNLPGLGFISSFKRDQIVSEHEEFQTCCQFRFFAAGIGRREPRLGYDRRRFCPLCSGQIPLTEFHLFSCQSLTDVRRETEINLFVSRCLAKNVILTRAYFLYVNGLDINGVSVSLEDILLRGRALLRLVDIFLKRW